MNSTKTICGRLMSVTAALMTAFALVLSSAATVNAAETAELTQVQDVLTGEIPAGEGAAQACPTETNPTADITENTEVPADQQVKVLFEDIKLIEELEIPKEEYRQLQAGALGITMDEFKLLASIIWCEAGNQSFEGKAAVANVVLNRVRSSKFPDTIHDVIYERRQFEPVGSGWLKRVLRQNTAPDDCYDAAIAALTGYAPAGECIYFERRGRTAKGLVIDGQCFWGKM